MKISIIKHLAENHTAEELFAAETCIINEENLCIEVEGSDEGEQLTHVLAAIWVKEEMLLNGTDLRTAIRKYSEKVRNSIN
jgi:hypothetical protein